MKAIDASHLLVILTAQETHSLGINVTSLSKGSLHCRLMIAKLFAIACSGTDFIKSKGQFAIKAMETIDGECVLMFSTISAAKGRPDGGRKIYKVKTQFDPYIYQFNSVEDLLSAIEQVYKVKIPCGKSTLVHSQENYHLIMTPSFPLRHRTNDILQEFGILCGKGKTSAAIILEHGELIHKDDAIEKIGVHLS